MFRQRNQHTIAQACTLAGRGYWTGQQVTLTFFPAEPRSGIRFVRTDLDGCPSVDASDRFRQDVDYRTVLVNGPVQVAMVEHVLAALAGLEIDNCLIELNGPEVPGFDGSAALIVELLQRAGMVMQAARRERVIVTHRIRVGSPSNWVEATPTRDSRLTIEYRLDYGPHSPIQEQIHQQTITPETFRRELAGARTFVTAAQVAELAAKGIGSHVAADELLIFDEHNLVSGSLRWPDECSRHKALDMVGDLALLGAELCGKVTSYRGGHRLNAALVRELRVQIDCEDVCRKAA